jgi:hypothetical protein
MVFKLIALSGPVLRSRRVVSVAIAFATAEAALEAAHDKE